MSVTLRQLCRSRRLLAMSALAWLMLVVGTLHAQTAMAPSMSHVAMTHAVTAMADDRCAPATTDADPSHAADCCDVGTDSLHCSCPATLGTVLPQPATAPLLAALRAQAPISGRLHADPPDRISGPPFRPPQA